MVNQNLLSLLQQINAAMVKTDEWDDPHFLSDLLKRLSSYYSSLGKPLADAEKAEALAERAYQIKRERIKIDQIKAGNAVKLSESMALLEVEQDIREHLDMKHLARLLFLTRQSLDKTMDMVRSSLSYSKTERESIRNNS